MLRFACTGVRPEPYAFGPSLLLDLRIRVEPGQQVHTLALKTQIRIEPRRRRYSPAEAEKLTDLFGELPRWGETLNPMQLTEVSTMVAGFTGQTEVSISVPLTYDIDIASTKYMHGLEDGEIPLLLLFSGTIFYRSTDGVQVGLVPWHEEATVRLPVSVWRATMDEHFPGVGLAPAPPRDAGRAVRVPLAAGHPQLGRDDGTAAQTGPVRCGVERR